MGKWFLAFLVMVLIVAAALGAAYLLYYQPQVRATEDARREASLCAQERSVLKTRASDLEHMLSELREQSAELEAQVQEKEQQLAALQSTQEELLSELEQEISQGQIQIERLRGQLRVDVVDEILFDSGEAELKPGGRDVLKRVADVLADADRRIDVQGHTDNVPIVGRLAETFPTNWELSAARAVNVVRFLHEEAGLAPDILSASAHSEYQPRASNETPKGRQKNRRIEILLLPPLEVESGAETAAR